MKYQLTLRILSFVTGSLLLLMAFSSLISYHIAIHRPMQGGWDLYRFEEITPQLLPYLLFGISTLLMTGLRLRRWIFFLVFTLYILSGSASLLLSVLVLLNIPDLWFHLLFVFVSFTAPLAWLFTESLTPRAEQGAAANP